MLWKKLLGGALLAIGVIGLFILLLDPFLDTAFGQEGNTVSCTGKIDYLLIDGAIDGNNVIFRDVACVDTLQTCRNWQPAAIWDFLYVGGSVGIEELSGTRISDVEKINVYASLADDFQLTACTTSDELNVVYYDTDGRASETKTVGVI